jgi:two-component system NarL family response regulator
MSSSTIRILLVEDDELFRLGLVTRLSQEASLEVTAEAEDGETAIAYVKQQVFDVVILDVGLPGIGGIETCCKIKEIQPKLPILILTSHSQSALINRLIESQAQGYCVKGVAAETLILAIRSVAVGASWWDAAASQEIQTAFQHGLPSSKAAILSDAVNPLTNREQEILSLVARGKSNQEIANELYISPGTVRVHIHTILQKLEVRDRTQAAIVAIQKGLVSVHGNALE